MNASDKCACVVVLGDVGRSPRMQYHAISLAKRGFDVDIIGYGGSETVNELSSNPKIIVKHLAKCPDFNKFCPQILGYILKVIWQSITLFCSLLFKRRSHHVIVQNPPAIPTLAVCWIYSVLASAKYIIDWHNYGHTIMALHLGQKHLLVQISEWFEAFFGRKAHSSLCVTIAMKDDLMKKWGIKAVTLYDRPSEIFKPISLLERHNLFERLANEYPEFKNSDINNTSTFTEMQSDGTIKLREDRPGLLVSSTSWTEDEDFSILLKALHDYESACSSNDTNLPDLVCAITGKGPMKEHYCNLISVANWKHVKVVTPWLQPDDYPQLLASADLGVSLHTSSSGLDLPMKVVDMFGCCLPVLAYNFQCLNELVKHKENSNTFDNAEELAAELQIWFRGFPTNPLQQEINAKFKTQLEAFQKLRWHDNWMITALQLFEVEEQP